jgi:SMODS-associated and fused to various effectors sensor domain
MAPGPILLVLHDSPLRTVGETEVLATLTPEELAQPRRIERIDTRPLEQDIKGGHWRSSHTYLREAAGRIRAAADACGAARVRYFGIGEVPHLIALGAYMSDERLMESRDLDRDRNRWEWPTSDRTLELAVHGLPREVVTLPGPAVVCVEISYPVQDADVDRSSDEID